ncbi:flagellar basal body P-ring formation chaperone FlgA [Dendrosporobacter sp. 1207_IL3150]|uniref:flagellar basal body P-ring formation chaperone FlgA n=1 Tax=Dendrosporobacter sp. 1207_IL3150 TaxID=3084054 RepID=UPI002FDB7770
MLKKILAICFVVALSLYINFPLVYAEAITVTVTEHATVRGPLITLGELAEISGEDSSRVQALQQTKLGSAPTPGGSIKLTSDILGMRLAAAGTNYAGITWHIPLSVRVTTGSQVISGQILVDEAISAIRNKVGSAIASSDLSVTPINELQDVLIPLGQISLNIELPYGIRYNAPTIARISISTDGTLYTRLNSSFEVKQYGKVVVAAKPISRNQVLAAEDLRYERTDIGRLNAGYFTNTEKVAGMQVRRPIVPGELISETMLAKPIIVKRGSIINILARIGDIEVKAAGQAQQDGSQGQIIRVQNTNSKKSVSARVLDEGTAQVVTFNGR